MEHHMTVADEVIETLEQMPGSTDRTIAEKRGRRHQQINGECRYLEQQGKVERRKGEDGVIRNYLARPRPLLTVV
jgi:hypothetical protein